MSVTLPSYNLLGLHVDSVSVQVEVGKGMPHFAITGMASASIREAKDRIRSALEHSGFRFPKTRKIIHLAPAEFPKRGSHFDLPMALGLLAATDQTPPPQEGWMSLGELGLDGGVRGVTGLIPGLLHAKQNCLFNVILPMANMAEASLVKGLNYYPVRCLREAVEAFAGNGMASTPNMKLAHLEHPWSLNDVHGHHHAKRALVLAAAGGHHLLMQGPPGTGKSLLARGFPSLLPPLSDEDQLEVMKIHSVAGLALHRGRPFRKVHHSTSRSQLLGGGTSGRPGELSLAHRGVLYLDEFPEFDRVVLESLRQPLEEGEIHLNRQQRSLRYPCRFQLIASMNPCPCGYYGDMQHPCQCHPYDLARYQKKLSGPLMDRLDLFIPVPRLDFTELKGETDPTLLELQESVRLAQGRQYNRQGKLNQELNAKEVKSLALNHEVNELLKAATERLGLSGRAVFKTIRLAQTIADLAGQEMDAGMVGEALGYRRT